MTQRVNEDALDVSADDGQVVEQLVSHFDHHDPRLGECFEAVYSQMREQCPVGFAAHNPCQFGAERKVRPT